MSKRDPLVRLRHMLDYSKEAVEMAKGFTSCEIKNKEIGPFWEAVLEHEAVAI